MKKRVNQLIIQKKLQEINFEMDFSNPKENPPSFQRRKIGHFSLKSINKTP